MRPYKVVGGCGGGWWISGPAFPEEADGPWHLDREQLERDCNMCNDVHEAATAPSRGGADSSSSLSSRPPAGA